MAACQEPNCRKQRNDRLPGTTLESNSPLGSQFVLLSSLAQPTVLNNPGCFGKKPSSLNMKDSSQQQLNTETVKYCDSHILCLDCGPGLVSGKYHLGLIPGYLTLLTLMVDDNSFCLEPKLNLDFGLNFAF